MSTLLLPLFIGAVLLTVAEGDVKRDTQMVEGGRGRIENSDDGGMASPSSGGNVNCRQECSGGQVCRKVCTPSGEWSSQQRPSRTVPQTPTDDGGAARRVRREDECHSECKNGSCFMLCE